MKGFLFITIAAVFYTAGVAAQSSNSIVGKWQLAGFIRNGESYSISDPKKAKEYLQQIEPSHIEPDSGKIAAWIDDMKILAELISIEFTANGKVFPTLQFGGDQLRDSLSYKVDTSKSVIIISGREVKKEMPFRFLKGNLVLPNDYVKGEEMILSRK